MRTFGIVFIAVGLISLFILLAPVDLGAPLWVAERVPSRMSLVKPGMTGPQVLAKKHGLTGYPIGGIAGGPTNDIHLGYQLRPGMNLVLQLEATGTGTTGRTLSTELVGSNASSRITGAVSLVINCLGIGMLAADTKLRQQLRTAHEE